MNALTDFQANNDFQTIHDSDGAPVFVVVPINDFRRITGELSSDSIPHAVVAAIVKGKTPMAAWREYLRMTQAEIAEKLGMTQSAYGQIENGQQPRKASLVKVAAALGIELEQLDVK